MPRIHLGLGTVQLGLPYGNRAGQELMPETEARAIVDLALKNGICFLDTAMAYGESEARLGRFQLAAREPSVEISTKVPVVSEEIWRNRDLLLKNLIDKVKSSSERLGLKKLGLLQFHQCDLAFLGDTGVQWAMATLLEKGLCSSIGISVYDPDQALAALAIPAVRALQVPVNLVDRRFVTEPMRAVYDRAGARVIVRSVLMQGILVPTAPLPPVKRSPALAELRRHLLEIAGTENLQQLAFRYLFGNLASVVDIGLIGVDSCQSLAENVALIDQAREPLTAEFLRATEPVCQYAEATGLLNPAHWNLP